jgi:hypothetical protein
LFLVRPYGQKAENVWGSGDSDISLPAEAAPVDDAIPAEVVGLLV